MMHSIKFTSALLAIHGALAAPNLLRARRLQPPGGGPPGGLGGGGSAGTTCSTTKAPTFTNPSAGTCLSLTSGVETNPSVCGRQLV